MAYSLQIKDKHVRLKVAGSRSSFKVRTVCYAAERPVRGLNLDREAGREAI
jgi:hypothetical protein